MTLEKMAERLRRKRNKLTRHISMYRNILATTKGILPLSEQEFLGEQIMLLNDSLGRLDANIEILEK